MFLDVTFGGFLVSFFGDCRWCHLCFLDQIYTAVMMLPIDSQVIVATQISVCSYPCVLH